MAISNIINTAESIYVDDHTEEVPNVNVSVRRTRRNKKVEEPSHILNGDINAKRGTELVMYVDETFYNDRKESQSNILA